jgi:hypothetical protein
VSRKFKDDDTGVVRRRIVTNVGKAEIPREETSSFGPGVGRDCGVRSAAQMGITDINRIVSVATAAVPRGRSASTRKRIRAQSVVGKV